MRSGGSRARVLGLAAVIGGVCGLGACAKGSQDEAGPAEPRPLVTAGGSGRGGAGAGGMAGGVAGTGGSGGGGAGGAPVVSGRTPCSMGEVETCTCQDTGTEGSRSCGFDSSSPEDGYFGECGGCAPPAMDAGSPCADGDKNGLETDTDCGGPDCDPCELGGTCVTDDDCSEGTCTSFTCTAAPTAGAGGASGAGGAGGAGTGGASGSGGAGAGGSSGSGGTGGTTPTTPVDDCEGYPQGTRCDRFCLGDRIGVCDDREDCECENP